MNDLHTNLSRISGILKQSPDDRINIFNKVKQVWNDALPSWIHHNTYDEYCRDTAQRPLRRGLTKRNTVPLTQAAPVEVYSDIAVSNSGNENTAPLVATHTTQLCVIGGMSESPKYLESTRLEDDAINGRTKNKGPDIDHESGPEKNVCDLETESYKGETPYTTGDRVGCAGGVSRTEDRESEQSAKTSSKEKLADQNDQDAIFADLSPIIPEDDLRDMYSHDADQTLYETDATGAAVEGAEPTTATEEDAITDNSHNTLSPIPALARSQDTMANLQNDLTVRATQNSQVTSTPGETNTVDSESSRKNLTPHPLEVTRFTATSSGIEVQDAQDDRSGIDKRAQEHVEIAGLRRDSLCESTADKERASTCNGPRRDSASHITGEGGDEWRMTFRRTSIGAFNLDRADLDTDQQPDLDAGDDGHSLIFPVPMAAAFSKSEQNTNPDKAHHYALRRRPSTSGRNTTKKTCAGSGKKRKSPVKQLRSNAKKAKPLKCNAKFTVIPNSLLPLSDCLVQPAEIHAKISNRLNTHDTDVTLMLTRLFYAIGSPESFYQLKIACTGVWNMSALSLSDNYGSIPPMRALDKLDVDVSVEPFLRRYHLAGLVASRDRGQAHYLAQDCRTQQPRLLRFGYTKPRAENTTGGTRLAMRQALKDLLLESYPNLYSVAETDPEYKSKLATLNQRLCSGRHWRALEDRYSSGILSLIPTGDTVCLFNSR